MQPRHSLFAALLLCFALAACDSAADLPADLATANVTQDQTNARSFRGVVPRFLDNVNISGEGEDACNDDRLNLTGQTWLGFKIDSFGETNRDGIRTTITGNKSLAWIANANVLVRAVLVKGGADSFIYDYNAASPFFSSDSELRSPVTGSNSNVPEISHYTICYTALDTPSQGCTLGYWKTHDGSGPQANAWGPTGYLPSDGVSSVFASYTGDPLTLTQALDLQGGGGVSGAQRTLLRQAVAALLSASHADVDYPRTAASVISDVNAALASGDRATMLALATALDADNNLGCPL